MEKLWKAWQRKLIPLTSRNRTLVVPKTRPRFCLDLWDFDFVAGFPVHQWIEKALIQSSSFPLLPVVDPRDGRSNELSLALQGLLKTARTWTEETGTAPLHLGYPMVEGKTRDDQIIRGPLFFIPVDIRIQDGFWQMTPQTPLWNQAFFLAYGQSTQQIPPMDWPWETHSFPSLLGFLTELHAWLSLHMPGIRMDSALFQQTIQPFPHWKIADLQKKPVGELSIVPHALLGIFPPFASYLGDDYTILMERFPDNPWEIWTNPPLLPFREEDALDPLPVDASQEEILNRVQQGASLVVQGPPGSGKSQLIANLVARFTARGKRVLVVCQKRAALDTVYERLHSLEAAPFVALVTDIQRDRAVVFEKLRFHIDQLTTYEASTQQWNTLFQDRTFRQASRRIDHLSQQLEHIRQGLFTPLPMGWPMKGIYLALGDIPPGPIWESPAFHRWSEDLYLEKKQAFLAYFSYAQKLESHDGFIQDGRVTFPWPQHLSPEARSTWEQYMQSWLGCIPDLTRWAGALDDSTLAAFWEWWGQIQSQPGCLAWFDQAIPTGINSQTLKQLRTWADQTLLPKDAPLEAVHAQLTKRIQQPWRQWLGDAGVCKPYRLSGESDESLLHRVQESQAWQKFKSQYPILSGDDPSEFMAHWEDIRLARRLRGQFPGCPWRTLLDGIAGQMAWHKYQNLERQWSNYVDPALLPYFRASPENTFTLVEKQRVWLFEMSQIYRNLTPDEQMLFPYIQQDPTWEETMRRSWLTHWQQFGEQLYPEISRLGSGHWAHVEDQLQEAIATKQAVVRAQWIHTLQAHTVKDLEHNRLRNPITYRPLQHQVQKKRQVWSLRKLWQHHSDEMTRLLPCWLVSPEAAAAIFPLDEEPAFDLVIFDEASQCPVEQGIPLLFRGKQVVIAGDTHQLRPSDLYQSVWEEDTFDIPELTVDSLLDLAMWHLPTVELTGHYRSEHPDLIRFSNHHFYQDKLHCLPTFSRWKQAEKPLQYHPVSGIWDGRQNALEAMYILSLLETLVQENHSIGVIAFNYHQARRIEQGVDAAGWTNVRVKNIENVQGDEYDVVIVSTTYGPNEKGVVQFQMGSLNRPGGENRLNVALTRARKSMHIVSSLPLPQLRDSEVHAEGVERLKQFLLEVSAYSQRGEWGKSETLHGLSARLAALYSLEATPFGLLGTDDTLWLTDDEAYEGALSAKENHAYFPRSLQQKGWAYRRAWSRAWAIGRNFGQ